MYGKVRWFRANELVNLAPEVLIRMPEYFGVGDGVNKIPVVVRVHPLVSVSKS